MIADVRDPIHVEAAALIRAIGTDRRDEEALLFQLRKRGHQDLLRVSG
jgi:hypothetical protein